MESTLDEVAKHCHVQLSLYTRCVEENAGNWEANCLLLKRALTKCAEENVTSLREVKQRCAEPIAAYQRCLADNTSDPSKCTAALKTLYECHNAAAASVAGTAGPAGGADIKTE
ncbi:hypothetical protein BDK51DRAFT_16084 [Blyttiomyces helicus]|uniref:IMS import disulfide relay-system CHCH-CHCH-like Cx9C domain-containing protein n=1 Tax=Blyttiomyces helicus TaxID=388810 RepID=A0A4P9WEE5_9FUNG|nr:hypothetical protein BDK51DRAFT_16084 [Blyttiomyces helicus]|eukprot:RKO89350.1 hypothetical protein BDK51DRAFT_16084 [Blyttiomyces helicus]